MSVPVFQTQPVVVTHVIDQRSAAGLTLCGGLWPGDTHSAFYAPRALCRACELAALEVGPRSRCERCRP